MEYFYLDCENIAPRTLEALDADQKVFLFLGEKPKKPDWILTEAIKDNADQIEIVPIVGQGNNALDFHIAYYIGKHAHADAKAAFTIVSKDKGFDPLVSHLKAGGIKCARIERMPVANTVRSGLRKRTAEFVAHLEGMSAKTRPKKISRLKAYIKHWLGKDGALSDDVYEEIRAAGTLSDAEGKLAYALPLRDV